MRLHGIPRLWQKRLIYASVAIVGIFFALQALFGFPLFKSFESDIKNDARVVIKDVSGTVSLKHLMKYLE